MCHIHVMDDIRNITAFAGQNEYADVRKNSMSECVAGKSLSNISICSDVLNGMSCCWYSIRLFAILLLVCIVYCNGMKKLFYGSWGLCGMRPKWLWRGGWILWIFRGGELWFRGKQATGWWDIRVNLVNLQRRGTVIPWQTGYRLVRH